MAEKVNLQKKIQEYRQTNPKLKNLSDENILSIMVQNGVISLSEEQKRSIFANNKTQNSNLGLHVEKSAQKSNPEKTIYLQSGRKVVYTKTANGKLALKYFGTDGTLLNPDYFKKVEGQISISADGTSYTLTKNDKKSEPIKAKDPTQGAIDQNLARLNNEEKRLNKTRKEQGFIGSSWDWIKNKTGIGDGSDKAQKQIEAERNLLNQIKTGKISKKDFKEVTGLDYSKENLEKFKRGELSQATAKIDGYKEGQEMASDVAGDMISGIAAVGIYTAAVAAAPFTGGASIAIGIAAATASGALIKAGVKALDTVGTDRKYTLKDFGHDCATGAFSGALAPITGGLGGAVGKTVATKLGIQAVKQVGKEVAEEVVEQGVKQGVKQGLKTALSNPTGYEYVGGTLVKRGTAMAAEMATDGTLGGAIDGGFRAGLDNDWDADAIIDGTIEGGVGGALMAPIIGGGFKAAGKGGQKLGEKIKGNKGANEAAEAAIGKEISEGSEEVSFKSQANENMSKKQGKTLEGGVKDTELEEVAPFAKHLIEERQIDDIAIPNKESLEIVNGDFVNGEFVPDGSTTYYTNGNNPLNKKSVTVQRSSYPSFEVAQNRKELTTQILGILGEKKIPKHLTKNFDKFLAKNPDIKISDISILIGRLNHIGHAKNFITEQGLRSIKDFKCFKANVENYAEFLYKLEHPEFGYGMNDINRAKIADYHFSDFIKFIEKIDPENFEVNCNTYLNMRGYFKNALNVKDFLTTVHEKKCLERIQILDDFNYKHTNWSGNYDRYNNIKPYFNLHELSNDKEFANLLERMEYCKKTKQYSSDDASRILHVGDNLERFKKFDSSIPEPIKFYSYKYFKDISANSPDNIDKFIEFCNKMPEDWFKSLFDTKYGKHYYREQRCNIFMTFGAKCYDENSYQGTRPDGSFGWCDYQPKEITPEEILKRLDIAKKVAHLACHKGEAHPYYINMILTDFNIKDIDKAQVFLNTVDENYLKRIKLDDRYDKNFDLFKLINSDNIDGMIANAKLYNELPENLRELFAKRSNETFDVPTEDFKARINILQKYGDVLDETTLLDIFTGKNTTDIKPYERWTQLPEELKLVASSSENIETLGILGDAEYQKFIRLFGGTKLKQNKFQDILWNLENNKNLFEELSYDELKVLPPNIFERNCYFIEIDKLKKHIQLVPEKLRPYMKDTTELVDPHSSWFNTEYSTAEKAQEAIQELNKLSDEDLAVMGSKTIAQWIDNARYSDIAHDLPLQKIEELKKIPKGALELLQQDGRDMYSLLVSKSNIDSNMITERYNLLAERNLSIDTSNFYKLINAGDNSYSIITTLLKDSNRKIENIDTYIYSLPSEDMVKSNSDFIFKYLINNPKNNTEDIPLQFDYISSFRKPTDEKKEIESAKNIVKGLIGRSDVIKVLLRYRMISEISPQTLADKVKKFIDLGFDEYFIDNIIMNSESLTFYSDEVLKILKQRSIDDPKTSLKELLQALTGNLPSQIQDRIDTLILLAKFTDEEVKVFKKQGVDVNFKIEELENLINAKHHLISTTQADVNAFLKAFANTQATDDVIRNADFEQFGKDGISLQYSREEFIKRMDELSGGDFSKAIQRSEYVEIPTLKMTQDDIVKSKETLEKFKTKYGANTKEYHIVIDGKETKITRFCGSKTDGSNEGDFAQIGDKLYYIKFPDETKLEQSIQEVMASELYRVAGIDAPNMKVMFDKDGKILGMASEYIPNVGDDANGKNLFDSFITDAWLADWDAPKHGNSVMRNGTCLKMDVGGSMEYRARGTKKENFGSIVNELTSLIEQNGDYYSMTKADVMSSLKHVTSVSDKQICKIIENVPAEYRNYTLGQKMITRRDFIKKFEQILEQMDETKYDNILDLMNNAKLQAIKEFDSGVDVASLLGYQRTALGFEGLLNTRDLSNLGLKPQKLAIARKMIKEIEDFTKFNRVADNVPLPNETKNFLNSILKGIPEFAAYFSKPQHSGTKYSLDIHILKVLQDSLKDPDYTKLGDQDKIVLKFATLLHDIGKRYLGSSSDTGHAALSSEYVYSILDRFKLSDDMKDRIISIVENHHWFKDFNNGVLSEETMATLARRPQDWLIYKIMAKADLVNVSEDFAIGHVKGATTINDLSQAFDKQVATIEEQIKKLREKQVVVTSTKWVDVPERVKSNGDILEARTFGRKTAEIDGVETEFKVLNLNEIADDEDMFKYGFNHLKRKDLRFIIHMPGDGSIKWFNVFKTLSQNPLNNSAQSLSMISVDDTSTYCGRMFGFILDVNNANISHAYYSNTGSGTGKGLQNFVHELFEDGHHRSFVKDQFVDFLKTERGIEIDDNAYAKITEYIMNKKFPETQLKGNFTIDDKTYKADDILDAFTFSRDQLIKETKEKTHGSHNEMVGLNAKVKGLVAKVNSFEELPEYFLRFAKENNLPIILIGNH